jgi:hypothetical protein
MNSKAFGKSKRELQQALQQQREMIAHVRGLLHTNGQLLLDQQRNTAVSARAPARAPARTSEVAPKSRKRRRGPHPPVGSPRVSIEDAEQRTNETLDNIRQERKRLGIAPRQDEDVADELLAQLEDDD